MKRFLSNYLQVGSTWNVVTYGMGNPYPYRNMPGPFTLKPMSNSRMISSVRYTFLLYSFPTVQGLRPTMRLETKSISHCITSETATCHERISTIP